jgi:hypothetical protein
MRIAARNGQFFTNENCITCAHGDPVRSFAASASCIPLRFSSRKARSVLALKTESS